MNSIHLQQTLPQVFADRNSVTSDVWHQDLIFRKEEMYLIEAASGTGKSSLCSYIYGYRNDYQGIINFDETNIKAYSVKQWVDLRKHSLSMLFQDLRIFTELTALENVQLKNNLTGCKKKKEISSDTLKWLNFYYSLSESDRNALSMIPSEFAGQISGNSMSANETSTSDSSYLEALTQEELDATEALAQYYFTEEVTSFEGVDQIYPADSSDPQYHNSGIEDDYGPGNIIIYRVLTNLDRRDGNPFRYISIARKSKSDDWKIINSGF